MIINSKISNYIILTLVLSLFICLSCKKKKTNTQVPNYPIPYTPVSVTIYPNDATNFSIQAIGGWKYITGAGVQGLIVYRKTQSDFLAIERASPENPNVAASALKVQSDNFTLKDTVKNARWQIIDGAPMNGTSQWQLRLYGTSYDGNVLRITN
jgi:hypothetical protein